MQEKYFFEIPIFRCTKEQFLKEREEEINRLVKYYKSMNPEVEDYDYKGMATSLEFWKIDRIFHLTDEERKKFISSIVDEEYKNVFNRIKDLSER